MYIKIRYEFFAVSSEPPRIPSAQYYALRGMLRQAWSVPPERRMNAMKTCSKVLSVILACALLIGTALPAFAAPAAGPHIEIEPAGEFTMDGLRSSYDSFLEVTGNNEAFVYSPKGEKIFEDKIQSVNYLERGLYEYGKAGATDVNSSALADADGNVLVPFECAFYAWPANSKDTQNRFILAYTGTEETENSEEALFYTTDSFSAIGGPGKDDVMYKGYARVFDIQEKKFIEGLQFEHVDKYETVNFIGNSILVKNEDETHTLYDAAGKKICDLSKKTEINDKYIIERTDSGEYKVYDDTGKDLYSSSGMISVPKSSSSYLTAYSDGKYTVIDAEGKTILQTPVEILYSEDKDTFRTKEGSVNKILDASGKALGETEGDCTVLGYGYYALETGVKTYTIVGPEGPTAEDAKQESYTCYVKDGKVVSFNEGKGYTDYDESAYYKKLGEYILCVTPSGGSPAIYDMFTGEKLADDGFKDASLHGDRLVLEYDGGTYKTYTITITDGK